MNQRKKDLVFSRTIFKLSFFLDNHIKVVQIEEVEEHPTRNNSTKTKIMWDDIQDMDSDVFDITELDEESSEMNIQCDEFKQTDFTV